MAVTLPRRIPIFPLPTTVLFPHVPLPLHIFEERYCAMMRDALAGPRVIGISLLKPGWEKNYEGSPDVYNVGCAGIITQYESLDNGCFNLILLGQQPFHIVQEHREKAYRTADVAYREDVLPSDTEVLGSLRAELIEQVNKLVRAGGATEKIIDAETTSLISDREFPNMLAHMLTLTPLEKQALVEESDLAGRYRKLIDMIHFWRLGVGQRRGSVQ